MATWREDLQRWSWANGNTDPIRFCCPPRRPGSAHPARDFTEAEKKVARHAIGEWNDALKEFAVRNGRSDMDRVVEGDPDGPNDITLRWEDDSFFKDWTQYDESTDPPTRGAGVDLGTTAGYADRVGGGSLERTDNPRTPFTPGRNTTDFPRSEIYLNLEAPDPLTRTIDGWFVDPTPEDDDEFELAPLDNGHMVLKAKEGGLADDKMDLYTVIKHEFGHMMGLDHRGSWDDANDRGQLMRSGVGGDERRHDVPTMSWMVEERRHLEPDDVARLEDVYRDAFEPGPGSGINVRTVLWIVAAVTILGVIIYLLR